MKQSLCVNDVNYSKSYITFMNAYEWTFAKLY